MFDNLNVKIEKKNLSKFDFQFRLPNLKMIKFLIKATIYPDIYELYYKLQDNLTFYKSACIPDYKTSVFMNSIFRHIKENINLDALEESDDDEEFENIADDKYVDLEKAIKFQCVYLKYYNSWKPLVESTENVCSYGEISKLEKYNTR